MSVVASFERKQSIAELEGQHETEARARSALDEFFELSPDAMVIVDWAGRLVAANPAAGHLFGYRAEDLTGRKLSTLFAGDLGSSLQITRDPQLNHSDYTSPLHRHATARFQIEGRTKAGTHFPVSLTLTPLTGSMETLTLALLRDSAFSSTTESAVVLAATRAAAREMASFQHDLLVELARGHGVSGIASVLHDRTRCKIMIQDSAGGLLAAAGYGAAARVPKNRPIGGRFNSLHAVRERHGDWWTAAACPDRTLLGRISVLDPVGDLSEGDLLALEQATSILAAELLHLQAVTSAEASRFSEFATELLEGCSFEHLSARARVLDYDLAQTHQTIVIQSPPIEGNKIEVVERVARNLGVQTPLVTSRSDRTILIVPNELSWESLAAALGVAFGTSTRIGVGGTYKLEEVRRSLAEAMFALELGTVLQSDLQVTTFADLGVWRILVDPNEPSKLREFVYEWIGALIDYDRLHGSELVKSLIQYLKESCATEAAAKSLYIHRNTLRYRLSKVAQITGRDLGDADQRFQLELACRAWAVLQALETK
jgi:PAS domain S-box-containing protein